MTAFRCVGSRLVMSINQERPGGRLSRPRLLFFAGGGTETGDHRASLVHRQSQLGQGGISSRP
jgi:hypothetical protein